MSYTPPSDLKARISDLEEWIEENKPYLSRQAIDELRAKMRGLLDDMADLSERQHRAAVDHSRLMERVEKLEKGETKATNNTFFSEERGDALRDALLAKYGTLPGVTGGTIKPAREMQWDWDKPQPQLHNPDDYGCPKMAEGETENEARLEAVWERYIREPGR